MMYVKGRKRTALYIAIAGVAASLVWTFFAIRFLLNLWLGLALLARAYGEVPPDQRPDNSRVPLEAILLAFSA